MQGEGEEEGGSRGNGYGGMGTERGMEGYFVMEM